ncbi:MAG: hypothetical protein AAFU80_21530 [Pseudomonadota bacterium]
MLHQPTDSAAPVPLPAAIQAQLDDPFFRIVLERQPDALSLDAVIATLTEGGRSEFSAFVVGEQIGRSEIPVAQTDPNCGGPTPMRRLVLSFNGAHGPTNLVLDGNVFISVFMTPDGPVGELEVMGWDDTHGTYNYYKTGAGTWRVRNRSSDLNTEPQSVLSDGCLACHVNGGPIMKEFTFPWNHWHSDLRFAARYLQPSGSDRWPIANSPLMTQLSDAFVLEEVIESSLKRFNQRTIDDQIAGAGPVTVTGLKGLLDSLFQPTELNLGSSREMSGLDEGGMTMRNTQPMPIPDSFFVNVKQMRLIDLPVFLGQPRVSRVFTPGALAPSLAEYERVLAEFDIDTACMPGRDTLFTWFGPEPSEFDRSMVEQLQARGIIDEQLIAAALAVDVETPLFSDQRASLLAHVPDQVTAPDRASVAGAVRQAIVANIEAISEPLRSAAEEELLELLADGDAVAALNAKVVALRDRVHSGLDLANPAQREQMLKDLYGRLIDNRADFISAPISARQAEFEGLFPLPN